MLTGRVVKFDEFHGYGFLSPDTGGDDVFVHVNDLSFDKHLLLPGVRVEFTAEEGERGLKASGVRLVESATTFAHKQTVPQPRAADQDDVMCDVLSSTELVAELTEKLLSQVPSLTGQQIGAVRRCQLELARSHGWIDD